MSKVLEEIFGLSVDEKLALVEAIWQSIPAQDQQQAIPDWHKEELNKRLIEIQNQQAERVDWEEFRIEFERYT
jgi:putative addiction module component (TIGR02574 family)